MQENKLIGKINGLGNLSISYDKIGYIRANDHDNLSFEYWGQQWWGTPHYYGILIDNIKHSICFGVWDNGDLRVILNDELMEIKSKSWKFQASTFYKNYAYVGDICSKAYCSGNSHQSTSRFGIAFCHDGVYFGEFPAGYKMKKCVGKHYDNQFNKFEGEFDLPIDVEVPWIDKDGGNFPF